MKTLSDNLSVSSAGTLLFAGHDTLALAQKYGTPLYLMDEQRIRRNCRTYVNAFKNAFGDRGLPLYAGKAAAFKRIYQIVREEGLGIDVVSAGEIHTAVQAGFPLENAYFHSNNKTDADIAYAMECGVGYFVVDNREELDAIDAAAQRAGIRQKLLLRLTPGIDPHTYEAISTGKVDSKFGTAIETGQAEQLVRYTLGLRGIELTGFHCHVGSLVFGEDVYQRTADIMLAFIADMQAKYGYTAQQFDIGGGYGVRYTDDDPQLDIAQKIAEVAAHMKAAAARLGITLPKILMEPGRSIVADAGLTLYTAGSVKRITGYKNYLSIDGGMTDNPRYALYGSRYTVYAAGRMNETPDLLCDVVGRCCESGDIIQPNVTLPAGVGRGDIIAVCTTGAYNYSMASNYNRLPRPPIVMLDGDRDYVAVRRESLADLTANDL